MGYKIESFPPHQNAKVFAILMAVVTFLFSIPFTIIMYFLVPEGQNSLAALTFIAYPIIYLIFGYITTFLLCWIYNWLQKYIGGVEFVLKGE